ncbi:TPA: hypothetical protein ACF00A_002194 [Acinetobacter nosocomialis]|nr:MULTISPECIES: hypothetical protein [Acinetobacter]EXF00402.1 hypothetical protein J594_1094 [Acinetobacter sp. 259052]EYT13676.1 hypothetical protein J595_03519 [Acinetobacter sp. 1592897]KRJ10660.1 hypothetical protein APC77_17215 [Acinetobacter nosocomialis]MBJ8489261.1 hypothetical protein [Acinetobacter pittii]MBK0408478.1 hypothetical protein [Acinetobacter pittii]
MLQICTGKLFSKDIEYRNNLKGIIYTNLKLFRDEKIQTKAGSIVYAENASSPNTVIYEIEELIEESERKPGLLISHGINSLILDFSAILSFALNCTASPSHSLTERLLSEQEGVSTQRSPNKMIKTVFDKNIFCSEESQKFFINFTNHLIGLERKTYIGVMSSIRTYVTGMHRIADDYELAYTLLVASIESLAQNFDGHQSTWEDYDQNKKKIIDEALKGCDEDISEKVREAILSIEHTSLRKRFQAFALEHVSPTFFREEADFAINPISRLDLPTALNNAYQARSKYVHNLIKLPKLLTLGEYSEFCIIKEKRWLTLQGLSRLARHVIIQFVLKQETVENEPYDYSLERSNILQVHLAPQHWIAAPDFSVGAGVQKLEGFLSQLRDCFTNVPNASVTDLTSVLDELELKIDTLKQDDKKAFLALYILYYTYLKDTYKDNEKRIKKVERFIKKHEKKFANPSVEGLIVKTLLILPFKWNIEEHEKYLKQYFSDRDKKNKIRCPDIFESGMILQLAERYREAGNEKKVLELIDLAVENLPAHKMLRNFEKEYKKNSQPFDSKDILFPLEEDIKA